VLPQCFDTDGLAGNTPGWLKLISINSSVSLVEHEKEHPDRETHTQPFYGPLSGTTGVGRYQKRHSPTLTCNVLWESVIILDFIKHGEDKRGKCADNSARCQTIRTIDAPSPSSPNFTLDALPAATLPIYPGLGQAPNVLDCIPGGLVK